MTDASDRLIEALTAIEQVADELTPDEAAGAFDAAALQAFWREWPDVSSWAGSLWRRLNEDLAAPASPQRDPQYQETGGDETGGGD